MSDKLKYLNQKSRLLMKAVGLENVKLNKKLKRYYEALPLVMKNIVLKDTNKSGALKRDVTGECEGDCRNRVKEGQMERQREINSSTI